MKKIKTKRKVERGNCRIIREESTKLELTKKRRQKTITKLIFNFN